jgi:RNA polymerase sigma factor (sigma-70 family)
MHYQMTTPSTAIDRDLLTIREVLKGNTAEYEKIIRQYNQQLFRIGVAYLGSEDGVEDVMQNTYLKAYAHLSQFKANAAFNTWLIRIMINECKQVLRKRERERTFYIQLQQDKEDVYDQGIHQSLIRKEMKEIVQQAILRLPVKYRTVFILREVEQLSTEETAAHLDLTPENVKVRLLRSKAMIREDLKESVAANELFHFYLTRCDQMVANVMKGIL